MKKLFTLLLLLVAAVGLVACGDEKNPDEPYSVAAFQQTVRAKIEEIKSRGKLPIIVGGTGLYIDSLLQNIQFSKEESNEEIRQELTALFDEKGAEYMLDWLREIDSETASRLHLNDRSRIIRALEIYKLTGKTKEDINNAVIEKRESMKNAE